MISPRARTAWLLRGPDGGLVAHHRHVEYPQGFGSLLHDLREQRGRSRRSLAVEMGVDPSYLARIEYGQREAPRLPIIQAICRALNLPRSEANALLVAGGHAPVELVRLGGWDGTLQAVVDVLTDDRLTERDRDDFRLLVEMTAARWITARRNES